MSSALDWPAGLPPVLRLEGLTNRLPVGVIRTAMETGPAKQRPRFTAAPEPLSGSLLLTREQTLLLDTFWQVTLAMGALSFNWIHPRTLEEAEMRFIATTAPEYSPADGLWVVRLELEVLP